MKRRRGPWGSFALTRQGWGFLVVTLAIGVGAINTGNNLLFLLLGFLASLLLLSGTLSDLSLYRLRAARRLPEAAVAGMPSVVEIVLRNEKKRLATYSVEVEDLLPGGASMATYVVKVDPRAEAVARYRYTPEHRGLVRFERVRVATRFPFGLIRKTRLLRVEDELVVYPAPLVGPVRLEERARRGIDVAPVGARTASEMAEIRDYREGDDPRRIHWPRSMAGRGLFVREAEAESPRTVQIYLDLDDDKRKRDIPVGRAAGAALDALSRGATVELRTDRGDRVMAAPQGGSGSLMRFLAVLPDEREP